MELLKWIKKFLKLFDRIGAPPPEPINYPPFERKLSRIASIDIERRKEEWQNHLHSVDLQNRQAAIRTLNRRRHTKFSYAEHFKKRQPTTARMLWKPNASIEEDDKEDD